MRNVSVSRKVSKISAASLDTAELKKASSTPLSSISPSIRQLTEKFSSTNSARNHGALSPGSNVAGKSTTLPRFKSRRGERSPSRNLFHEDSGYLQVTDTVLTESPTDTKVKQQTFYSGTDSVSGSDSDRNQQLIYTRKSAQGSSVGTGKRDYSQIDPSISDNNNCSETLNAEDYVFVSGAPACKSHRSYFPSHHGDPPVHIDLTNWPSVTKIRELFGDRHRKKHRSTSDAEDLKSADHLELFSSSKENSVSGRSDRQSPNSPTPEATSLSLSDRHRSRAASLGRERRHQGMDSAFHPDQHYSDKAEIEPASASISRSGMFLRVAQPSNTHRPHSPSSGGEEPETRPSSLNSDPPLSVLAAGPTSPPRSSSRGLSSSCVCPSVEQQQSQGAGQPRDSLHSSHSSSRPVAPSSDRASARAAITARWRFSSGDEEEEYHRAGGRSAPSLGVSGSYLSRGKNGWWGGKVPGRSSGSEEDSPASLGPSRDTMRRRSLRKKKKNSEVAIATGRDNGESDDSDDEQTGMMEHLERHQQNTAATTEQAGSSRNRLREPEGSRNNAAQRGRNYTPNQMVAQESYRRQYTSGGPGTSSPLTTPLTGVSRVSKVNISSFISSPCGSQTSSRYCSTETLKEDQASYANRMANTTTTTTTPGSTTVFQRLISGGVVGDKDRNRMSVSNPDIASETMSLLSFLKSDLSELRVRKTDRSGVTEGSSAVYRMGSRGLHPGLRPSLKDLTATLRRAKSFTYSDKPEGRQHSDGSSAKRSSSEQRLDLDGELMPTPLQDRYVQEARQVIRDICQMSARKDDDNEDDMLGDSEENVFYDRFVDELSGHESSLTDEGIVTEPETGPGDPERLFVGSITGMSSVNNNSTSGRTNVSQSASAPGLEAPPTPSAIRRRRKFSSAGNTGSDSSNGSNGESNGDPTVYRSLSDPMPHRRHSVSEEGNNSFSVDSNLLGSLSLSSKGAGGVGGGSVPESSSAADLSECTGSVTSELSVYSDGGLRDDSLRDDYSNVIRSIVAEPGAMDRLMTDDKNNGKATKKKSFSDPSRRGDGHLLDESGFKSHHHPNEPISELDQLGQIPPSSSEPILSEQRDELWELGDERGKLRSQSERELHSCLYGDDTDGGGQILNFDPELAEVLSPKMGRRASRKRSNRVAQTASEELDHSEPGPEDHARSKHVRHASEPATFIPISPPPQPPPALLPASEPSILCQPTGVEAPSLEDVTKRYILALNAPGCEGEPSGPGSGGTVPVPDGSNSSPATPTGAREPRLTQCCLPLQDMRRHVVMTLLDTEQSYVESLRTLIQGYMRPLKQPDSGSLVDPSLVDEMFYQIPEILEHHEHFLEQVTGCISQWHDKQTVGQLLIQSFSKEILANIYSAYIENFLNAKDAVRIAKEAKPAFLKFLETSMRENKEKQALGDLMIKPVQRIPRYELLVKDLLKHTPEEHPDHPLLLDAQRDIKRLAEKINKGRRSAEEVERETRVMQEIEAHIEGVEHILNPMRKFLRQEMVMEAKTVGGKKDRSLFLFSDLLICTTLKRKSGSLRRSSMSLYSAASVIDTSSKYKFLWKLPLEDVEIVKSPSQATNKETIQKMIGRLDEDLSTLGHISKLSETLSFPHQSLDDVIKDLMVSVHRELAEKQSLAFSMSFLPTKLELTTASAETSFVFEFSSPDTRSNFQQAFEDAKKQLAMNKDQWDPEFLKAIPIMKTRSGMQFSCASPSHSCPESSSEVWVCNSDGYVGQVCLLNIRDQPTVEACIAVCSARIICIAAVPGLKGRLVHRAYILQPVSPRERGVDPFPAPPRVAVDSTPSQQQLHISISHSSLQLTEPPSGAGPELVPFDSDDTDDEDSPSPSSTLQSQASHSTVSSSYANEEGSGSKDMATETTSSEEEQDYPEASPYGAPGRPGVGGRGRPHSESPMDGRAMRRSSRGSFTRASLEDLLSIDPEAYQSSVWLGTEDGCIHVYQSSDNIRNRKNSMKMQHSAPILCVLYLDNKVFVSLANGEVIVYQREAGSFWDAQSSQTLSLGTPSSPVTKMVPVGGKLWCGSQNRVLIINTTTLVQEHWFQVGTDSSRCVTCMVSYGQGVWLALQGSAQIRLYHAQTWDSLTEVDVAPAVHKMLAGSDAIIRQHKAACLRITALLGCKDLLWIGTSAGVVLTLSIPAVSSGTVSGTLRSPLTPMGSAHGHTGHVRFLTSIELPEGFNVNFPLPADTTGNHRRDSSHRRASALLPVKTNQLVISGGDGYEDFRLTNSSSETVGRDDSTNHLLLWRV
uniref:DH domain-containing protein n=1 Tax=Oncorhynchus tshawytscha TaxID=74940 RepID=A0AAZ3PDZ2_ONCTS